MDRRRFLHTAGPGLAALSLGLGGCNDPEPDEVAQLGTPADPFPALNFITRDPAHTDYRPAVDATGTQVVFERQTHPHPADQPPLLVLAQGIHQPAPSLGPLIPPTAMVTVPFPDSQTRPDWNWATGKIAFTGEVTGTKGTEVYILSADRSQLSVLPNSRWHIYPMWSSDGDFLVLDNSDGVPAPVRPVSALFTSGGAVREHNLNGTDLSSQAVSMFGGFAAPKPGMPRSIAYAGQPALASWGVLPGQPMPLEPVYNQDNNYIFLNTLVGGAYRSSPMEPGASVQTYDPAYQGRAPYWSPDGRYIVFESSRAGGYALFLADLSTGAPPVQLTNGLYWAQHAKFFPDGRRLVCTALQQPNAQGSGPRGIAIINISAFVT